MWVSCTHLLKFMANNKKYTFIDLFAGCGGLSEGFLATGKYEALAHVEWESPMIDTLRHRLVQKWGHTVEDAEKRVIQFDVQKTDELMKGNWSEESISTYGKRNNPFIIANGIDGLIGDKTVDLIIGGPPCQAYSLCGRAQDPNSMKNDYRNYLFESFVKIVDHLGGVTVELNQDEVNYLNGFDYATKVHTGSNTLPGDVALEYVRIRSSNGSDSDIHRTARQRNFVIQIINQVRNQNLAQIDKLIKEVLPMVLTDMEDSDITKLMVELLPLLPELKIETHQCPAEGTYYGDWVQIGGYDAAVLKCDVGANRKLLMDICEPEGSLEE